jgi:hypothetical protein
VDQEIRKKLGTALDHLDYIKFSGWCLVKIEITTAVSTWLFPEEETARGRSLSFFHHQSFRLIMTS